MSNDERPLNTEEPYYTWGIYQGKLTISSECCSDSFSPDQEAALLEVLLERRHGGPYAE